MIIPGLGHSARVLAAISPSISCSGIIPVVKLSLRWCNREKDEPGRNRRSHEGAKTSSDTGLEFYDGWLLPRMGALQTLTGCVSGSHESLIL